MTSYYDLLFVVRMHSMHIVDSRCMSTVGQRRADFVRLICITDN